MCCDGTLFSNARLTRPQKNGAVSLGMRVVDRTDEDGGSTLWFELPCHLHIEGRCSIYDQWRPDICGDYTCGVLDAYLDGSRSLDECVQIVGDVRANAVEAHAAIAAESGGKPPTAPEMLAIAAMDVYRRRYFNKRDKQHSVPD